VVRWKVVGTVMYLVDILWTFYLMGDSITCLSLVGSTIYLTELVLDLVKVYHSMDPMFCLSWHQAQEVVYLDLVSRHMDVHTAPM
jgi:hypothetical protein